jgi:FkbM family methyltransferase
MPYRRNKLRTACEIVQQLKNWPTAWALRINRRSGGLRLLRFRNGLNVICRGATGDWDVIHELVFAQSYGRALKYLAKIEHPTTVFDFGGNIGLFSLLAAQTNPMTTIHTFEPGPPNLRLLEINCLANPILGERIHIHKAGVGSTTKLTKWHFDEKNPGGSSLFGEANRGIDVRIESFVEVIEAVSGEIALAKIDIEGAEYAILKDTPAEVWKRIRAISLELHNDPAKGMSNAEFLDRMKMLGYRIEPEQVCSFFLQQ